MCPRRTCENNSFLGQRNLQCLSSSFVTDLAEFEIEKIETAFANCLETKRTDSFDHHRLVFLEGNVSSEVEIQ